MFIGDKSKALSIRDNVNAIKNMRIFMIKLRNQIIYQMLNYLMSTWDVKPLPWPIYLLHKLTPHNFIFIGVIELIMRLELLKTILK